jgi:hypothetical protein
VDRLAPEKFVGVKAAELQNVTFRNDNRDPTRHFSVVKPTVEFCMIPGTGTAVPPDLPTGIDPV